MVWGWSYNGGAFVECGRITIVHEGDRTFVRVDTADDAYSGPIRLELMRDLLLAELKQQHSERARASTVIKRARGSRVGRPSAKIPASVIEDVAEGYRTAADAARAWGVSTMTMKRRVAALKAKQ